MIAPGTALDLICHVVILATGLDKTTGTIYAYVRRDSDGHWLKADGSWTATTAAPAGADLPTATYLAQGVWRLSLSAGVTGALTLGDKLACRMTDNETPASATVVSDVVEHMVGPTAASIADAMHDEDLSEHTADGSAGEAFARLDATVGSRSTFAGGAVASVAGDVGGKVLGGGLSSIAGVGAHVLDDAGAAVMPLGTYVAPDNTGIAAAATAAGLTAAQAAIVAALPGEPPAASSIADAVWDEAIAGHAGVGSTGAALASASAPTAAAIADAVLDELLAAHTVAGSLGKVLADAKVDTAAIRVLLTESIAAAVSAVVGAGGTLGGTISIAKGEDKSFSLAATGCDLTACKVWLTVRRNTLATSPVLLTRGNTAAGGGGDEILVTGALTATVYLDPEDTSALEAGTYTYDVWIEEADGERTQIVRPAKMQVLTAVKQAWA